MFGFVKKYKERNSYLRMFPNALHSDVEKVINLLPFDLHPSYKSQATSLVLDSESIAIYYRIYKLDPTWFLEYELTDNQKLILSCIYTRHPDGFLREKHLKKILTDEKPWTTPFVVMLLGEYVVELAQLVEVNLIKKETQELYIKFIDENPVFWKKTKSRMISYWDIYYRDRFVDKRDYPGMRIVKTIEEQMRGCKIRDDSGLL